MGQSKSSLEGDGWYYAAPSGQFGPYRLEDLRIKIATIPDVQDLFVWRDGMANWQQVSSVPGLSATSVPPPPPRVLQGLLDA